MKTSELWIEELKKKESRWIECVDIDEDSIKAVQLDAWRQGMTDAANLIGNVTILKDHGFIEPFSHSGHDCEAVKQAILTARDVRVVL